MEPLVAPMIARLASEMPELAGRVQAAADFAGLVRANAAPQAELSAFVVPEGGEAAAQDAATGVHRQVVTRRAAVVLFLRGGTPTGDRLIDRIEALVAEVVRALAGWVPPGALADAMAFRGWQNAPAPDRPGTFAVIVRFSARDRLRITQGA